MKRIFTLLLCAVMLIACLPAAAADSKDAPTADTSDTSVSLFSCDSVDVWTSEAEIALDAEDKTEGEASVAFSFDVLKDSDATISFEAAFTRINVIGANALSFDLYISDPELFRSTYITTMDLSSSGEPESQVLNWSGEVFSSITKPGWYHIQLPFSKAMNLAFNDSSVNYFRLYLFHINPTEDLNDLVVKLDNFKVNVPAYRTTMVEACDTPEGWTGNMAPYAAAPVLDTAVKKQGSGSLRYTVNLPQEVHLVSHKLYAAPINVKGATHVEMDVYISDVNVLKNCGYAIQFEVTSSGTCDQQEYSWSLDKYVSKSGWTHVRMPIEAATICIGSNPELAGQPDLSRVNYFRFHTLNISAASNNQFVFRVDNISFSFPVSEQQEPLYGATPIIFEGEGGENNEGNEGNEENEGGENQAPIPNFPGQGGTTENNKENDLRARQTQQRAKVLLLVMVFAIIGVDIVAVALKRKRQTEAAVVTGDVPPDEVN